MQSIKRERCIIMCKGYLIFGKISQIYLIEAKFLIAVNNAFRATHFCHISLETEYSAGRIISYTILRGCSSFNIQPIIYSLYYSIIMQENCSSDV